MGAGLIQKNQVNKTNYRKYYVIGVILAIILILFVLFFFFSFKVSKEIVPFCGDSTFEGSCSLTKPYFCRENNLVLEPSLCGCSESYTLIEGECLSKYKTPNKTYSFEYSFDTKEGILSFESYSEVLDHLLTLPRIKSYSKGEIPRRDDFKLAKINDEVQREFLMPLIVEIQNAFPNSKDMQAKLAVKLVQDIPYEEPEFVKVFGTNEVRLARYPYQVLSELAGSCEGKSELLALILRELEFGVALFYYHPENHEAIGIRCPMEYSYKNSGYCFVETTMPSPISYAEGRYLGLAGQGRLISQPQMILINDGISLGDLEDYEDARDLNDLINKIDEDGTLNVFQKNRMDELREKYGLLY